ncbi:glycosyltransferase family 2 protein [Geothermobacter hydrogeniphilus]|uniref:Glycosyltransferase 2-like domain-containing protein n=1 Tax=Geothermobacter hydrogeniphilus TaxID=1969733 RepID=A0A1X0Y1Q5_9BACT|nr:glycosyltransferase family 2 protein [Geothermobacter hydrogeniphilus]ORJ59120.1 hypothetical protein B5V00_11165 [Geothermobacter hydrogeniphilus]
MNSFCNKRVKVAAVVVLYRPDGDVLRCILSYANQVGRVFLVDNSENPETDKFQDFCNDEQNIEYCALGDNYGIARALNVGAEKAIAAGYDLLLTMDQDSMAAPNMVKYQLRAGDSLGWEKISIISPMHRIGFDHEKSMGDVYDVESAWTSGCLLNLHVYQKIGCFEEELFIDFVDHEYCLRSRVHGFRVVKVNAAELYHAIGDGARRVKVFGLPLIVSNHSPLRRYYITRNRLYVTKKFRKEFTGFYWMDKVYFISELITVLFFEKQKMDKIIMIFRGVLDYFNGVMGKCHYV